MKSATLFEKVNKYGVFRTFIMGSIPITRSK